MAVLSKAALPTWLGPFALGCALGLSVGIALLAQHSRRRPCRRSPALARSGRRKPRKHLPRGDAAGDADGVELGDCSRDVLCQDAVAWLEELPERGLPQDSCILTGVPDIHEVDPEGRMGIDGWQHWFMRVVELVLQRLPEGSVAVFMQTDVKVAREGVADCSSKESRGTYWRWLDKSHLAMVAAERVPSSRLLWHKIIFSGALGTGGGRNSSVAGYTHFMCFTTSMAPEALEGFAFPDVLRKGLSTWASGSGVQAVEEVCMYLRSRGCSLVVDPFCGEGAVLAIANALGMGALGVEISKKRAKVARRQDGERLLAADRAERVQSVYGTH